MELTDKQLEIIRKMARHIEYGAITINISASAHTIDLIIQNRVKLEKESGEHKNYKKT
jgi:hypothetical protein